MRIGSITENMISQRRVQGVGSRYTYVARQLVNRVDLEDGQIICGENMDGKIMASSRPLSFDSYAHPLLFGQD